MTKQRQRLGRQGEDAAARLYEERGWQIIDRNFRCKFGEIDVIATRGSIAVFCEVKTRTGTEYGFPLEAVTARKAARLRRLAATWLHERDLRVPDIRIDLVGVLRPRRGAAQVEHVRGVA